MKWIIEEDVFDEEYLEPMRNTLGDLGLKEGRGYEIIKYVPFSDSTYLPIIPDNKAIVYGSINLLKQVGRYTKWDPGACVSWSNYRYSDYFPYWNNYLFNSTTRWYSLKEMLKRVDKLFQYPQWIKSDAGDKTWAGGVYTKEEFLYEAEFRWSNGLSLDTLMIIDSPTSSYRQIEREWRIFCIEKEIITGSQYRLGDNKKIDSDVPDDVMCFAQKMLDDVCFIPDPVFALDICLAGKPIGSLKESLYLLELSAFNCAGLYGCDIHKLVTRVHQYYRFIE